MNLNLAVHNRLNHLGIVPKKEFAAGNVTLALGAVFGVLALAGVIATSWLALGIGLGILGLVAMTHGAQRNKMQCSAKLISPISYRPAIVFTALRCCLSNADIEAGTGPTIRDCSLDPNTLSPSLGGYNPDDGYGSGLDD